MTDDAQRNQMQRQAICQKEQNMKGDNSINESLSNDFGQSGVFFNDFCNVQQAARLSHKRQRNFDLLE